MGQARLTLRSPPASALGSDESFRPVRVISQSLTTGCSAKRPLLPLQGKLLLLRLWCGTGSRLTKAPFHLLFISYWGNTEDALTNIGVTVILLL